MNSPYRAHARRRTVLTAALGGAALAASGCDASSTQSRTATGAAVDLPDHTPYDGVKADLAPTKDGVLAGFYRYPAAPATGSTEKPGSGGTVTAMTQGGTPPERPPGNSYWQRLNERLGVDLNLNLAPAAQYPAKLATTIAGGELPDIVQFPLLQPNMTGLLTAKFADLSDLLSGDRINEFPFLANLATQSWKSARFGGRIFGIPKPFGNIGQMMFTRRDILITRGLDAPVTSFDDFRQLMHSLTEPRQNRWSSSQPLETVDFVLEMLGVFKGWTQDGGRLVHGFEDERFTQALEAVRSLVADNVFHPDSLSSSNSQAERWYAAGTTALSYNSYSVWTSYTKASDARTDPATKLRVGAIPPPSFESGRKTSAKNLGPGSWGFVALKMASPDRLREILRVLNWLASPFGTANYLYSYYGTPGVHHESVNGNPVLTDAGRKQANLALSYIAAPPPVLYVPNNVDATREQHEYQMATIPTGVSDASIGLYSDTMSRKNAQLEKTMLDIRADILAGRKPVSAWADGVKDWRRNGGDAIRDELGAAKQDQ